MHATAKLTLQAAPIKIMHFILQTKLSFVKYSLSNYTHNHTFQYLIQTQKHTKTNGENKEEKVGEKKIGTL